MPIFGLSKAFGVGRGVRVFLNLQTGATRGKVPDPWHRRDASKALKQKDRQIYHLRKQLKEQRENVFRLTNELAATNELADRSQDAVSDSPVPGEEVGALPDFAVIGAMRGGTSRFYSLLIKHPFVKGAAAKELHFFDRPERFEKGLDWYKRCFPQPEPKDGRWTITGEATPKYLFDPEVPERMARIVPGARLVVLLRNPVDRAYSQYHRWARTGVDTPSFEETVEEELAWLTGDRGGPSGQDHRPDAALGGRYNQLARGIYVDQLARWRQFFDEEQMLVIRSEDFFKRPVEVLELTQDFLGLPKREINLPPRRTKPKSTYEYEPMDPALKQRLETFFEPHNQRLYNYLGRDFGW